MNLEQEAAKITEELGKVIFIGAVAVNYYAKFRSTRDIDLVVTNPLSEEELFELGYKKKVKSRNSWYTPRGIQADFYTKDVGGIPVDWIARTALPVRIRKKVIRIIAFEGLIVAKHRAGRSQDIADLRHLMTSHGQEIQWSLVSQIATDLETKELKQVATALS